MSKNYIHPEMDFQELSVDRSFLASQQSKATRPNITYENESDFDSFFGN